MPLPSAKKREKKFKSTKEPKSDEYHEERMEIARWVRFAAAASELGGGASNQARPSSLGRALQIITDLHVMLRNSRHGALLGQNLEQGELLDPESTFNNILEALSGAPSSVSRKFDALEDETRGQSHKKELEIIMKELRQHREMDGYVATLASVSPQLIKYLEDAFDYIASQRRSFGMLLEKTRRPDLNEMLERLDSDISRLTERCEELKAKVALNKAEGIPLPSESTMRDATGCSSCTHSNPVLTEQELDVAMKDIEMVDEGQSDDLANIDRVVKETSSNLDSVGI